METIKAYVSNDGKLKYVGAPDSVRFDNTHNISIPRLKIKKTAIQSFTSGSLASPLTQRWPLQFKGRCSVTNAWLKSWNRAFESDGWIILEDVELECESYKK